MLEKIGLPGMGNTAGTSKREGVVEAAMKSAAQGAGLDYMMVQTDQPLDAALREYLSRRQGRL